MEDKEQMERKILNADESSNFLDHNYENEVVIDSIFSVSKKIIYLGSLILLSMVIGELRIILLFAFSKTFGLQQLEAIGSVLITYQIIGYGLGWACTQGYGFKSADFFAANELHKLAQVTNKAFLLAGIISIIFAIFFFFFASLLFGLFIQDIETLGNLNILFKCISFALPFQFLQFVLLRYFSAIDSTESLIISPIFGLIIQICFQFFFISWLGLIDIGLGISYSLGTGTTFGINFWYYLKRNSYSEYILPYDFKETFNDLWSFVIYSIPLGGLVFLTMLSYDIIPILAFMQGDRVFSAYSIIITLLSVSYMFSESISSSCNILINYSKGEGNIKKIHNVLLSSIAVISVYIVIIVLLLILFYSEIINLFTNVKDIIDITNSMKPAFLISFALLSFHSLTSEAITALDYEMFPIYTVIVGRYILVIVLSIVFIKAANMDQNSILIALIIGQTAILVTNLIFLFKIVKQIDKEPSNKKKKKKKKKN